MSHAICFPAGFMLFTIMTCATAEPLIDFTEYLGPFVGENALLHPDNEMPHRILYYGTDLGWSYEHDGKIHFLFGDTWATEVYAPIESATGSKFDDSFGEIDLADWPDPARITKSSIPRIRLGQHAGSAEAKAIDPGHAMDLGKTPMAGFSNGRHEFGVFNIGKGRVCRTHTDCSDGLACDTTLGYLGVPATAEEFLTLPCRDGAPGCNADTMIDAAGTAIPGTGFCVDDTSSVGREPVSNLLTTMGLRTRIGTRDASDPGKYGHAHDWLTNKFMNVNVRTVQDFVPGRAEQNYAPARDSGAGRRLFLWGRPGFVGVNAAGRNLGLYFAWMDLPTGPDFSWKPKYYAGSENGIPRFSEDQREAVPLDLDSSREGNQPEEIYDVVDQHSIAWVAPLSKWVMIYGGGMGKSYREGLPVCGVLQLFTGAECTKVNVGNGAFRMRTADNPWGPWTPPQDVIVAGDPAEPKLQYGPGGALRHPACAQPDCAPHSDTPYYQQGEYGFFYAPNIIEQWTRPVAGGVDILWNASTWDPYRVILLRTRIRNAE
jgi:hypothetical protein